MADAPYLYFCTEWIWVGKGCLQNIAPEAKKMDVKKVLMITDPGVHEAGVSAKVKGALEKGGIKVEIFSSVKPEPPLELANECAALAKKEKVDLLVGLGGGSSMDTAKGASIVMTNGGSVADYVGIELTRKPGFPSFLIPTTAGTGAEVTRNAIFKDLRGKAKRVVVSRHTLARVAIVDPELTVTTPPRPTAYTGIDALGHAIESYMSKNANPLSEMYALKAIGLVHQYLPRAVKNGNDMEARENMALAALCGGVSLVAGAGGIAATSYPVEGHFDVPHGVGNGIMMPYIVEYNVPANISKGKKIAEQFGIKVQGMSDEKVVTNLVDDIFRLLKEVGLPTKLGEMGVKADAIPMLVKETLQLERLIKSNPAELTPKAVEEIYRKAM